MGLQDMPGEEPVVEVAGIISHNVQVESLCLPCLLHTQACPGQQSALVYIFRSICDRVGLATRLPGQGCPVMSGDDLLCLEDQTMHPGFDQDLGQHTEQEKED